MDVRNVQARTAKLLPGRSALVILYILLMTFGQYVSQRAVQCLAYAVLFPLCFCMVGRKHMEEGFERGATFKWMCGYLILYVASTFVTMTAAESWPLCILTALTCSLFLLYVPAGHGKENVRREMLMIGALMTGLYMPFELLALLSVFTGKVIRVPLFPGVVGIRQAGNVADRIRIFVNPNTVAIYATVNILFAVYAIFACKRRWVRAFFVLAIVINYFTLAHTQSRTSGIAFSVAVAAMVLRGVQLLLAHKKWRWIAGAAAAAMAFMIVLNGVNVLYKADVWLAYRLTGADRETMEEFISPMDRKGQFNVTGSGRGEVWSSALKYMRNHPEILLIGKGQVDGADVIGEEYPAIIPHGGLHSSYLGAVFYCGLPFLICVLGFLCTLVPPAIRLLLRPEEREQRGNFVIPVMVGMLLVMAVGEEMLFTIPCYPNALFYIFSGYLLKFGTLAKHTD